MQTARNLNFAKVGHRKSRNGCYKCKTRRVKCDEAKPVCQNCARLGLETGCTWPSHYQPSSKAHSVAISTPKSPAKSKIDPNGKPCVSSEPVDLDGPQHEIPESRSRRLLEHRLMQNYFFNILDIFPIPSSQSWRTLFHKTIPSMALKYENLLYSLFALSATNILSRERQDRELFDARQSYLVLATREQQTMVDAMTIDSASPICLAALLILLNTFAMLQERVLEPYTPPIEWLQMGKGAGCMLRISIGYLLKNGDGSNSELMALANAPPHIGIDESYFDPSMRAEFDGILDQNMTSGDTWDAATRNAYEKTLSYVGSIQKSLRRGEPVYVVARRIQAFPMVVPHKFIDFLSEERPRALVILAHYFATVSQLRDIWWLGDGKEGIEPTASREINAIRMVLPEEWKGHMIWPLDMLGST